MKTCVRAMAAGALAVCALFFVWRTGAAAASEPSCAPASGYVIQFCVNVPSGQVVRPETTLPSRIVATMRTDVALETATPATLVIGVEDAPKVTLFAASSDAIVEQATPMSAAEVAPTATLSPRAQLPARSYPRSFWTYDALVEYASSVAEEQEALNERLAAVTARSGLVQSRADLMGGVTTEALRSQLASDAATQEELVGSGAVLGASVPWRLPLIGEITQEFGPSSLRLEPALDYEGTFYKHFHAGTDIAAHWGTPIYAPSGGTVVFAGTMGDGAVVVVIAHDSGLVSMYAHLDGRVLPPPVKAGDAVQPGDQIGSVGLTGITTGAHLHWGVWRNGVVIDPLSVVGG